MADRVGLDVFGVGEHHRADYAVSAPAMVLAAAAARTERIRLTSSVTVLGSEDPVRVFQNFATLDHLSGGRAEIMAGRGSFIESFPLFGQDLNEYDEVFAEKLDLLLRLRDTNPITWSGRHRAPIEDRPVYPRSAQNPLPIWLAVGGTPNSVLRAAQLGLPMALAIIGGEPARFRSITDAYRQATDQLGHGRLPLGISSHGFVAETTAEAIETAWEPFAATMNRIGRERGWPPTSRAHFDRERSLPGALVLGSPDDLVEKILYQHELFGHERFLLQLTVGPIPHEKVLRAIELFGTEVAPRVRKALSGAAIGARRDGGLSQSRQDPT